MVQHIQCIASEVHRGLLETLLRGRFRGVRLIEMVPNSSICLMVEIPNLRRLPNTVLRLEKI